MTKRSGFRRSIQVKLWWLFVTGMAVAAMLVAAVVLINSGATTSDPLRAILGVGVLIAAVATISLAGVFVRARIVAPIESLREGAAAFAAGNLAYRIHTDTGDELQSLAEEINDMSAALQQSQARLAAMAREREREAEFAQARMREMTALIQSGRAITSLDLKDVLSRLAYEAARAVQGDRCSIYVLDSRQRRLVLRGEWEAPHTYSPRLSSATGEGPGVRASGNGHDRVGTVAYEWGEGVVGWVAQAEKPIFLANAQADKRFVAKAPNDGEIAALVGVPVHSDNAVVGVLQASTRPGTPAFDVSDQRLLSTFAGQAAAAIKNSYLYEIERRRAKEMSIIAEIIRAISSSLDLDATLNSILSSVGQLISYDLAEITLWDPQAEVLRTRGRGADLKYDEYSRTAGGVYRLGQGITGWVASHRLPLLLPDLAASEVQPAVDLEQFPIRSVVGVPMISAQQLVGTIELASYTANAFNESHLDTLRTIAAQAAVAIQNARLFIDSRRRAEEAAGLFRVASIAASAQEPNEIMKQIMAEAAQLMGAQLGVVLLYRPETQRLEAHPTALFGAPYERVLDMKIDTHKPTFHHSVFRSGRVFRSDDAPGDRRILREYRPFVERFGARRTLSAPLIVRDSPIGEVHIVRTAGAPFDLDDEQRLMTLATLLAGVIETNRLAIERVARVDELEGLYEISQAISALTDLQQVYSQITRSIAERVGVQYAGVLLYDPRREMLVSQPPFYGVPDDVLEHYLIPVAPGSVAHRLWTEGDTWISNDVPNDPLTKEAGLDGLARMVGVERTLFAAMKIGTRRIGVIQVSNKRDGQPFGEDDARLMSIYAAQIAAVVENARLYAQTDVRLQQRVEELTALSNISQELNATLERERILDLVLNEAVRSTGAARGAVALVEPGRAELVLAAMLGYTPEEIERARLLSQRVGEGIIGAVIEKGTSMVVDDVRRNSDYLQVSEQTQSELCVPIRYALEVVGAINLESPRLGYFTRDHVAFLTALAAHAAIAIGNTQRYEDQLRRGELLRRRAEQLANLFEIGQAFRSDRPLVEVLEDVVHAVQQTAGFNVVLLSVLEGDPPALERVAAAGLPVTRLEEMKKVHTPWESVGAIMHDAFRISQSYYVPAEHTAVTSQLDTWPPFRADMVPRASGRWHEQDLLFTPLRASGDRILGIISVDEPFDGRVPDRATIETLELFVNQAAIAIENARLLEDLQQRIDSLTLFNQVSRTISARLDLDGVLATIVDASIELAKANTATIFMRDDAGVFRPRKSHGWQPEQIAHLKWAEGEGLVGSVAREGRAVIVPDAKADPLFTPDPTDSVIGAMLLVPIAVSGAVIGVLSVDKPAPRSFANTDLLMLSTLADQAAIAIANARLFAETQRRVAELQSINAISQAITATMPLSQLVDLIRRELGRILDTSNFYIALYDSSAGRITFPIFYERGAIVHPPPIPPGEGATGHIYTTRRPLVVNAADEWQTLGIRTLGQDSQSYLGVPMTYGDLVSGVMAVQDYERAHAYDEGHVRILTTIAAQSAVAIENARLFEETQRRLREQGLLYEAGRAISASLDYKAVLETAADHLLRITGLQGAIFSDWDRGRDCLTIIYSRYADLTGVSNPDAAGRTYPLPEYPRIRRALHEREVLLLRPDDAALDPREREAVARAGFRFVLTVPMIARDQIIGSVWLVESREHHPLGETDLHLIATLVNQIASVLTNARLFDEVRRFSLELEERVRQRTEELARANADLTLERDRVETLYRITSELSMSLDLDRVLNRALALVNEAVGTRRSSILLVDQETDRLIHRAAMGRGEHLAPGGRPTRFRRHEGLAGWVIRNRLPAIVADIRADDRWLELPDASPPASGGSRRGGDPAGRGASSREYRSALAVPLIASDDALGALLLLHPDAGYFEDSHLRLVEAAATQAATAISNAALYGFIRENAERLGAMLRDKQIEAAKAQAILESVADGVLVTDASETVILFNAAAERILGRARETVLNRPTADIIGLYGASGAQWEEQIQQWHSSPESRRGTPSLSTTVQFADDNRFVRVSIAPVAGPGDEFLGTVSVVRDITAEVEADRTKTEFVSTVSHELRTPMTSIRGYADLLLMGAAGSLNENQERFLSIIKSNANRLSELVADLLDVSRIDTGRFVLDLKHVSMVAVVEQVLTSLHERIEQKGLTIETELPEGDSLIVLGDHARLLQILTNLVSNSHQYTRSGGTITLRARRMPDGEMLCVEVEDTGIGISEEDKSKVFDRFFRADDPVVQEFSGTGLGLAITQSLVEMHGGEIWVNSEPEHGTTFSFTVPLAEEIQPAEAASEMDADLVIAPAWARGVAPHVPRILVVEDDPDIASLIERNLAHVGYSVQTVGTGKAALEIVKRDRPDLVTLDIYLPDIDGQEVLATLKSDPETADIPVIVVSVVSDGKASLEAGAIDFLSKPLEAPRLIDAVSRVLGHIGSILIVEDDLDTTHMLTESLQRAGYRVMVTSNGRQAIALARDDQPNLILLDLRLPRMDGVTILHNLKRSPKTAKIPVVIMTGSVTLDTVRRQQFLAMGAVDFLAKPFDVPMLIHKIESVLKTDHESEAE